jgi:hypothetical protein
MYAAIQVSERNVCHYPADACAGQPAGSISYENETASHDAPGWVAGVSDTGLSGTHPMSVSPSCLPAGARRAWGATGSGAMT